VNEDANAKLIRELKDEIRRLKTLLTQEGLFVEDETEDSTASNNNAGPSNNDCAIEVTSSSSPMHTTNANHPRLVKNSTSSITEEAVEQLQANEKLIAGTKVTVQVLFTRLRHTPDCPYILQLYFKYRAK